MDMDASGSMTAVQNTLDRLGTQRDELGDLWNTRKLRLDLCLQLRLFERYAVEVRVKREKYPIIASFVGLVYKLKVEAIQRHHY